jgi:small basic protein
MMSRVERINGAVDSTLGVVRHIVTATVDAFEECFASVAIPGADAAIALLAAQNMFTQLGFSLAVSAITAISLEGVALVANRAALRCRYYNQTHKGEPPAMETLAWGLLVLNFLIGIVLVVVNTVAVDARMWGVISVAFLGSVGTLAHVIENDVKAREVGAKPATAVLPSPDRIEQVIADIAPATAKDRVMWAYRENPHADKREVARALGIGYSTVSKAYRELRAENAIPANGDGGR